MQRRLFGNNFASSLDLSHGSLTKWPGGYVNLATFSVVLNTELPHWWFIPIWLPSILWVTLNLALPVSASLDLLTRLFLQVHSQPQWQAVSIALCCFTVEMYKQPSWQLVSVLTMEKKWHKGHLNVKVKLHTNTLFVLRFWHQSLEPLKNGSFILRNEFWIHLGIC